MRGDYSGYTTQKGRQMLNSMLVMPRYLTVVKWAWILVNNLLQLAHRNGLLKDRSRLLCFLGHLGICDETRCWIGRCVNLGQGGVCSSKFHRPSDLCA